MKLSFSSCPLHVGSRQSTTVVSITVAGSKSRFRPRIKWVHGIRGQFKRNRFQTTVKHQMFATQPTYSEQLSLVKNSGYVAFLSREFLFLLITPIVWTGPRQTTWHQWWWRLDAGEGVRVPFLVGNLRFGLLMFTNFFVVSAFTWINSKTMFSLVNPDCI